MKSKFYVNNPKINKIHESKYCTVTQKFIRKLDKMNKIYKNKFIKIDMIIWIKLYSTINFIK